MNLEEAKKLLTSATREELVDETFGDSEVYWFVNGEEVGNGYFGSTVEEVTAIDLQTGDTGCFDDKEARELRHLGTLKKVERNDGRA